jgi:hypothetical protein
VNEAMKVSIKSPVGAAFSAGDVENPGPMLERIETSTGTLLEKFITDAVYWNEANAQVCSDRGIGAYISIGRQKQGQLPPPLLGPFPMNLDAIAEGCDDFSNPSGPGLTHRRL